MAEDFKKLIKEKKLWIGTRQTLKYLKQGKVKKIFLSSNCPESVSASVKHYASLGHVDIEQLSTPNDELGPLCKKQFAISVLGLKKE